MADIQAHVTIFNNSDQPATVREEISRLSYTVAAGETKEKDLPHERLTAKTAAGAAGSLSVAVKNITQKAWQLRVFAGGASQQLDPNETANLSGVTVDFKIEGR